jgi:hypothetical protein
MGCHVLDRAIVIQLDISISQSRHALAGIDSAGEWGNLGRESGNLANEGINSE